MVFYSLYVAFRGIILLNKSKEAIDCQKTKNYQGLSADSPKFMS